MRLLPKPISKEDFDYVSDKSVDSLKSDIQQLFDKSKGWNFSINLTGEFTSDSEFKMTPKWQFVHIRGGDSSEAYLNGRIFEDEYRRTRVKFTVRPNSIYPLFFFIFPLFGLLALTSDDTRNKDVADIVGLILMVVVVGPGSMLLFGYFAKQRIKDRFIKTFNLKPVDY